MTMTPTTAYHVYRVFGKNNGPLLKTSSYSEAAEYCQKHDTRAHPLMLSKVEFVAWGNAV